MPIRLLLADNHPIVLDGVEQLFQLESDFEVVGHCARGEDVLPALLKWKPDVLVLAIVPHSISWTVGGANHAAS
jgi:DNA-binding NarL/FixJ family response regulator